MTATRKDAERAWATPPPPYKKVREAVAHYLDLTDMDLKDFGEAIGYSGHTFKMWMYGSYKNVAADDTYIRAAAWQFLEQNPVEAKKEFKGRLFETENYRHIKRLFRRAIEHGEIVLLYGPPGTQKTFALEHEIFALNREKKQLAIYVYASQEMSVLALLKRIGRAAGVRIGQHIRERILHNIIEALSRRESLPAIVVDEAQHLSVVCLEILREIHDRSGCGLVLAGSHNLYQGFTRPERRAHLEQWLSRIDHRDQLPGLHEDEVAQIAMRELGIDKPTVKFVDALVKNCRVDDIFARGDDGKPESRTYLSVRRLVKLIAQYKAKKEVE